MTEPTWLTAAEALERLAGRGVTVSDETLRRWARAGQLDHIRTPSGQFRFSSVAIDAVTEPVVTA